MANPFLLETIRGTAATNTVQIASLIATLSRSIELLSADIEAEEATTAVHDTSNPDCSMLARSLRACRENIKVTLGALQKLVGETAAEAA